MTAFTFGSLFSGIGGIDLGLERAGMQCRFQVEVDPYCLKVLAKHWPDVPKFGDIHAVTGDELERVDLIAGGFPCQPVSLAGRRRGQDDERWLWPEFARIIRLLRPRYVFVENVPGLLNRGFGDVLGDLAAIGYDAEWQSLPAAAFGAPHLRWRVWLVAYADHGGQRHRSDQPEPEPERGFTANASVGREDVADAHPGRRPGWAGWDDTGGRREPANGGQSRADSVGTRLEIFPREPRDFAEELASSERACDWREWWAVEPPVGRVVTGFPGRVDRLKGLGNAVVPQVAEQIGKWIIAADERRAAMTAPRKPATDTAPPVPKWWAGHPNPERSRAHRISSWWFVARRTLCGLPLQPEWVRLCPLAREECPTCARIARAE